MTWLTITTATDEQLQHYWAKTLLINGYKYCWPRLRGVAMVPLPFREGNEALGSPPSQWHARASSISISEPAASSKDGRPLPGMPAPSFENHESTESGGTMWKAGQITIASQQADRASLGQPALYTP